MFHEAAMQNRTSTRGFAHRVPVPKGTTDYRLAGAVRQAFGGIAILVILAGCAATPKQYLDETSWVDVTGAYQLTDREAFETIDLGKLLRQYAPQGSPSKCKGLDKVPTPARNASGQPPSAATGAEAMSGGLEDALHYYNDKIRGVSDQQQRTSRNALQERLLAASAQRCNAYKGNLQRTFSRTNFGLGVLSTIAGTAGALVNSASAASGWSAVSAISSGSRAEFNQDFMSNLAAYVIVDGIDKRRRTIYEQIQSRGQAKSYEAYPVEAAIKDALYYHGQCSVIAGFQEASDSIKTANEPGVNAAINAMAKIRAANLMVHDDKQSPEAILATSKKITSDSQPIAGTSLRDEEETGVAMDDFATQIGHIASTNVLLQSAWGELATEARASSTLKDRLEELGLKQPPEPSTNIEEPLTNCLTTLAGYSARASAATIQAGLETNASMREGKLAEAEFYRAQGNQIFAAARLLAQDYRSKAEIRINNWKDLFEKAKDATDKTTKETTKAFSEGLLLLPDLDRALVQVLTALCKPSAS